MPNQFKAKVQEKLEKTLRAERAAIEEVTTALNRRDYATASHALTLANTFRGAIMVYEGLLQEEAQKPQPYTPKGPVN